ncbi:MAG: hypothetical protein WCO91_12265 [Gemmataceae bacterium]
MGRLLSIEAVALRLGKSTSWVRQAVRLGLFPRSVSGCRGRWREESINEYVEAKDKAAAQVLVARSSWPRPQLETR